MSFFSGRRQSDETQETAQASTVHIGFDTVLSASAILEGTLKSSGNIRLDGTFTGKLDITGNILVGETADINADIEARNISIAGKVHGNVIGNKVQLLKTGHIWGDIQANTLTTEEGAFIDGKITMTLPKTVDEPMIVEDRIEDETIESVESELDQTQDDINSDDTNDKDEAD